jgi:hypothetical protein
MKGTRYLGYKANYRVLRVEEGRGRIQLSFEWTPTYDKIEIPSGGEDGWIPRFHSFKASGTLEMAPDQPSLAATWRTEAPLSEKDKGGLRQLFLFVTWTDNAPAP